MLAFESRERDFTRPDLLLLLLFVLRRIKVLINSRAAGINAQKPLIQFVSHSFGSFRLRHRKVFCFPRIESDVVQFIAIILVVVDQFPVATRNDGAGLSALISVVRIVPVQIAIVNGAAMQQRLEADAINVLVCKRLLARYSQ